MKRKISYLLVFTMLLSTVFGSGFIMPVFADEPVDNFFSSFEEFEDEDGDVVLPYDVLEHENVNGKGTAYYTINSEYDLTTTTSDVSHQGGASETNINLVDKSQSTKWCSTSSAALPRNFIFDAGSPVAPIAYYIRGANDDMGSISRVLHTWQIQGSNTKDALNSDWTTVLDSQSGVKWTSNYQMQIFRIQNPQPFRYYRLTVTARGEDGTASGGTMQFSDFGLISDYVQKGSNDVTEYLYPQIMTAPGVMWDATARAWSGSYVLTVNGNTAAAADGQKTVSAKNDIRIYKDLNIKVYPDTKLSYMITPEGKKASYADNDYDYQLTSQHMAIDLKFADGTRLKDLGAKDMYGFGLNPVDQGRSKMYHVSAWNYVESEIGKVAAGKVITEIIVSFEMPDAPPDMKAKATFDDIKIYREDIDVDAIDLADFVDIRQGTYVGNLANGAMMPIVARPNPFNMWAPSTNASGASKYTYINSGLKGITISHVASRHMGERGSLQFMTDAVTTLATDAQSAVNSRNGYFTHDNEIAHNYHYAVTFNEDDARNPGGVKLEVTPTDHAAVLRFTFPAGAAARNILMHAPDQTTAAYSNMNRDSDTSRVFNAWQQTLNDDNVGHNAANAFQNASSGMKRMYIYGEFSHDPTSFTVPSTSYARSMVSFPDLGNGPNGETIIELKVATSFIGADQAKNNMDLEIDASPAKTAWFDEVCAESKDVWNTLLGRVKIEDPDASYWDLVDFYSKLSRANLYPTILHENTGTKEAPVWQYASPYRGTIANRVVKDGYYIYNEGWWDTYRSKWAQLGFLRPNDTGVLMDGTVQHFIENNSRGNFAVPRWIAPGGHALMVMTSSDVVTADMFMRGVNFNYQDGYAAAVKSATVYSKYQSNGGRHGIQESIFKGYTPYGAAEPGGGGGQLDTSWGLEGFLNDAGIAKMAMKMRDMETPGTEAWTQLNDEYIYFQNRAKYYTNYFDPDTLGSVNSPGWMRNKNRAGQWLGGNGSTTAAFNALDWGWGFCEENAYPYTILAPQDGAGLANLYGGQEAFGVKMEHISTNWEADYRGGGYGGWIHEGGEKREVKLGQLALSNQPGYHMPYMWLFSDRPEMANYYVRAGLLQISGSSPTGRGYIGEEDNGSLSSWYVWGCLGLYPLDIGSGQLVIGSPKFKKVTITTDDDRTYTLRAPETSFENKYVTGLKVNGQEYNKLYLPVELFKDGLDVEYKMSAEPTDWARNAERPPSLTEGDGLDNTPDILMDIAAENVSIVSSMPDPTQTTDAAYVTNIAASGNNSAVYLFDNASVTTPNRQNQGLKTTYDANFTAQTADITYYSAVPVKVEMYTLTSSNTQGADPKTWTLSGSNDGTVWTELDARNLPNIETYTENYNNTSADNAETRTDETFRWRIQTRPFSIDAAKQGRYKYYRLSITAASGTANLSLAQFELLADQYASVDRSDLLAKINQAKAIDSTLYGAIEYLAMLDEIVIAEAVYEKTDTTGKEISNAIDKLQSAIDSLILVKKAYIPFNATEFSNASSGIGIESTTTAEGSDIAVGIVVPNIGGSKPGSILAYNYIDFGNGEKAYTRARATYAGNTTDCNGAHMIVRLDSPDGPVIADIDTPPTAEGTAWNVYKYGYGDIEVPVSGIHTVYIELLNGGGNHVANIYQFVFETDEDVTAPDWIVNPVVTKADSEITVNASVRNNTETAESVNVYAAVYTAEGRLADVDVRTIDVPGNTWVSIDSIALSASAAGDGYYIKVFGWRASDFIPLVEASTR